jgi:hypothetical protein
VVISLYFIWDAISMEYVIDGVPGPGFFPLWIAILMGVIALFILYDAARNKSEENKKPIFNKKFWRNTGIVIGGSVISMLLMYIIGVLAAVGLLTGFLSWALGTKGYKINLSLTVFTPLAFWLIFEQALQVNLPKGLLGF